MIQKVLLVIGVIAFVYFLFIKKKPELRQTTKKSKRTKEQTPSNEMVECEACGIYCDIDESILSNNKYYCSSECVRKS
jgi:uncharacterized protein